ncbi:MAG: UMP kinase [Planctomycetota bacterium]|nr:MAG: UMP kinase [Planctomycetota bacterium]
MSTPPAADPQAKPNLISVLGRAPRRVLLKISGEAFSKPGGFGIDAEELSLIASEICEAHSVGVQIAVVVGGGNIIRGADLAASGDIHQATADYMGMLGTVINAAALKEKLLKFGVDSRVQSALEINALAEPFIRGRAIRHLEKSRVVILAAGTGNPFFTTDTCASLRASELDCDVLLKATKVDGVYTADPKVDPNATRYAHLTFAEAMAKRLAVMDMTALAMCQERRLPVLVFDFKKKHNIRRVIEGACIGTVLTSD